MYKLDKEEKWPENRTLIYLQLMLFRQRLDKWDEVPYVDVFFTLRNDHETQKKCILLTSDSNVMMMMDDIKKPSQCCSICGIGKRCVKLQDEEEDVWMLVAPDGEGVTSGLDEGNATFSLVSRRTRAQQRPVISASFRLAVGPDGSLVYVKVPFTTSDLMNWRESTGIIILG